MKLTVLAMAAVIGFTAFQRASARVPTYGYQIVRSYPHDRGAFTQGLIFRDGVLYEGTGLHGRSGIRKVKPETGEVLQSRPLASEYFGEGITEWKGQIVQLTWQSEVGFVYDLRTFEPKKRWTYTGEGWGPRTTARGSS
jgi:glutamine cyclotransferase